MRIIFPFLVVALVACAHPREAPATLRPAGSAASIAASSTASSTAATRPDSASATVALTASDTAPMEMPTGAELLKLIKRLPPGSFPRLRRAVRYNLERRPCELPQGGGAPHNV